MAELLIVGVLVDSLTFIIRSAITGELLRVDIRSELQKLNEMLQTAHRHRRADIDLANLCYELLRIADFVATTLVDRIPYQRIYTRSTGSCMDMAATSYRRFIYSQPFRQDLRRIKGRISKIEPRVMTCLERLGIQLGDMTTAVDEQEQHTSTWRPSFKFGNNMETFDDRFSGIIRSLLQQHRSGNTGVATAMRETTIRIVGTGGLGKTALAKRICQDYRVKEHFADCLWPKTSKNTSPIDAVKGILTLVRGPVDEMLNDVGMLLDVLSRSLCSTKYLFVLDDATNTSECDFLLNAFLSIDMGQNRILITTRSTDVAPYALTHQLQLNDEDGWQLFKFKLQLPPHAQSQQFLEDYGREILSFCMGLPSIISSVATTLSSAEAEDGWVSERDRLKEDLHQSLDTAANSLAEYLVQCLYYFVLFKKGSDMPARRLINLLVAEGMVIPFGNGVPLETVAEEYLTELVERNWVQVVDRKPNGKVRTYRMLPLLMDYWLLKAQEANFMNERHRETPRTTVANHWRVFLQTTTVADHWRVFLQTLSSIRSSRTISLSDAFTCRFFGRTIGLIPNSYSMLILPFLLDSSEAGVHRLSDHHDQQDPNYAHIHRYNSTLVAKFRARYLNLRFLLSFDSREGSEPGEEIGKFLKRGIQWGCFNKMKVLDLERVFRPQLPKYIGCLIHLKYLGLRWTYLEKLPSSIHKLLKLHTLDLKHTYISQLPKSLWKMTQLRHLYLSESYRTRFAHPPRSIYLTHLQTLWGAFLDHDIYPHLQRTLFQLKKISKLGLTYRLTIDEQKAPAEWITKKLTELESLRLISIDDKVKPFDLYIEPLSGLNKLSRIYLLGKLATSSPPLALDTLFPANLTELTLSFSGLETDPMPVLEKLQNLRVLGLLCKSFIGVSMSSSPGGFPVLEKLMLWKLDELETLDVAEGSLRWLKELDIRSCAALQEVPEGLAHLKLLMELNIIGMPDGFASRVKEEDGLDWWKIAHVEKINGKVSSSQQQSREIGSPSTSYC